MQSAVTHILPLTKIRRARLLPVDGKVLVRPGQKVAATDPMAEANTGGEHVLVDIRRGLQLSASQKLDGLIEYRVGDRVQAGDVLAQKGGLFKRVVRAPVAGQIVAILGGQVMIEKAALPKTVHAGFAGMVAETITDRGAILETDGALVQGVWGNEKADQGLLLCLVNSPDDELTRDRLDVSMRGAVVLGGHCESADVLQAAGELPLRGLVLGSMSSALIAQAEKQPYPIILLEGFGRIPINAEAYRVLTTNDKRETCVNAARLDWFTGERPEVVIPLPAVGDFAPSAGELAGGSKVRVLGGEHAGKIGKVAQLQPGLTYLPSGLRTTAALVRFETGEALVPLANLDMLE